MKEGEVDKKDRRKEESKGRMREGTVGIERMIEGRWRSWRVD